MKYLIIWEILTDKLLILLFRILSKMFLLFLIKSSKSKRRAEVLLPSKTE